MVFLHIFLLKLWEFDPKLGNSTNIPDAGNGSGAINNGVNNVSNEVPISGRYVRKNKPLYEQQTTLIKIASDLL